MKNTSSSSLIVVLIILLSNKTFAATEEKRACFLSHRIRISVTNNLPTNLVARCQDGSHDLGRQEIAPNNNINWTFCDDIFGFSLYFCHLYWGNKQRVFDVYSDQLERFECGHHCYWSAKQDGIYLNAKKKYDWQQ